MNEQEGRVFLGVFPADVGDLERTLIHRVFQGEISLFIIFHLDFKNKLGINILLFGQEYVKGLKSIYCH